MLQKSNSSAAGVKTVYKKVSEAVEELIGSLGNTEAKVIRIALADHQCVNQSFDLLGWTYPNWPQVDFKESKGGKKRKRAKASDKLTSRSKQGGRGHGHAGGPKVDRVIAAKIPASTVGSPVVAAKPVSMTSLAVR